jgi:hypothetical protein
MSGIRAICFRYFVLLRSRVRGEFGSPSSSLSCDESVLCCTWLPSVDALSHDLKNLSTRASFVSAVRRMVCGVDASN